MICKHPKCRKEHNGSYGSGRFCSNKCAKSFSSFINREEINKKVSEKLKGKLKPQYLKSYICDICGEVFKSLTIRTKYKKCDLCKNLELKNFEAIQWRTKSKILKRARKGCIICNWNEESLDIHHIIPKSRGGTDDDANLIFLCPNCHRLADRKNFSNEYLFSLSIEKKFSEWREYYRI